MFLYRFDSRPSSCRAGPRIGARVAQALGSVRPNGGTAMYDAVAEAVPLAQSGTRRKKALVVISDGNDTSSRTTLGELQQRIRETEVLVYAIGIDASGGIGSNSHAASSSSAAPVEPAAARCRCPRRFPAKRRRAVQAPPPPPPPPPPPSTLAIIAVVRRIASNPDALRALTDDSGGRTEIIVSPRDLDPATAGIADELSRQYFLGYTSTRAEGRALAHHPAQAQTGQLRRASAQGVCRVVAVSDDE